MGAGGKNAVYRFDRFMLDLARGALLTAGGAEVALRPKAFALLRHLVENAGRLLDRDEIMNAVWPGVFVTEDSVRQCIKEIRRALGDEEQRLLRTLLRRGYLFAAAVSRTEPMAAAAVPPGGAVALTPAVPVGGRPTLAILPFANMTGDPGQECLADGLTEDLTTALSHPRWFSVVSRSSAFTYKGRAADVRQVGRELGAGYVLEGSAQRADGRVRITARLCEAEGGRQVWTGRLDSGPGDMFDLQDGVTEAVAAALEPGLRLAEVERTRRKPVETLSAYELLLRAQPQRWVTRAGNDEALCLLRRAAAIDPSLTAVNGALAGAIALRFALGWAEAGDVAEGLQCARETVESGGKDDPGALAWAAHALAYFSGDYSSGLAAANHALRLAPHSTQVLLNTGYLRVYVGDAPVAAAHLERAMQLNPHDPMMFLMATGLGLVHFADGRYERAAALARRAIHDRPTYLPAHRLLATSLAHLGRSDAAQASVHAMLTRAAPGYTLTAAVNHSAIHDPALRGRYIDGLHRAGLPE